MLRSGNQSLAGKHFRPVLHNSNVFSQLGAGGGSSLALNYNFSSSHSSIPIFMEFQKGVGVGKYILWRRALAAGQELDHYQPQSISDHTVLDIGWGTSRPVSTGLQSPREKLSSRKFSVLKTTVRWSWSDHHRLGYFISSQHRAQSWAQSSCNHCSQFQVDCALL